MAIALAERQDIVKTIDGSLEFDPTEEVLSDDDEALRRKAARISGPSKEAIELFSPYNVVFEFASNRKAAGINSQFKLFMSLLAWVPSAGSFFTSVFLESILMIDTVPDSSDVTWEIPATILPATLAGDLGIIEGFLLEPLDRETGKTAADLLQKKRKKPVRVKRATSPKIPREKKKKEEQTSFKSAQFVSI